MEFLKDIEETQPFQYLLTLLDPENFQTTIPDDVIDRVILRNDSSNYMITSPGGEGSFTIEFYPETTNEVIGAIFLFDQTAGRDKWLANLLRSTNLRDDFNWIRSIAKSLKVRLNSRTMDRDYISGRMSAVESQVGLSEIGNALTYSNLLGVVNNSECKKSVNINEGLVAVSLPRRLDKDFSRLKDDASFTVQTSPGGVSGNTVANLTSEGGCIFRANYGDVINYTTPNAWQEVSSRIFDLDMVPGVIFNLTQRLTPTSNIGGNLYTRYLITTYDLMGDATNSPYQIANNEESGLTTGFPIDKTYNSMKAQETDLSLHQSAPIHKIKVTCEAFNSAAIANLSMATQLYITLNGGNSYENLRPVHIIKGQGLPTDSVLEISLYTADEVIPNGGLQRNTNLLHPNFSPISKKLATMLMAHGLESDVKPFYTFDEHEEIVARFKNTTLSSEDQKIVMEASSRNWMKTLSKVLRGAKSAYKVAKPFLQQTPIAQVLPVTDLVLESASAPAFKQRRYYAADIDTGQDLQTIVDNHHDIPSVTYTRQKDDTMVMFPAVFTAGDKAVVGSFCAISGDKTYLEGSKRRRHYRKTKGIQKVYGLFNSADRLNLKLKKDVTILPVKSVSDQQIEVYTVGPTLDGNSLKAAVKIAGCFTGIWNPRYLVSADLFEQKEDSILLPIGEVSRKVDYAKKLDKKLITTRSDLPNTINKSYVRQVANLLRDSQGSGTLLPDEPAKNPVQSDFSVAYATDVFKPTPVEIELLKIIRKTTTNPEYLIFKCADDEPAFKQGYQYEDYSEAEEDDDANQTFAANQRAIKHNLNKVLTASLDEEKVGYLFASKFEKLQNLMGLIESIFDDNPNETWEDVDKELGKQLTHFKKYKMFPTGASKEPLIDGISFKAWDWLRVASDQTDVPQWSELDKEVQNRIKQFPFIYLNTRLTFALEDKRGISNGIIRKAKRGVIEGPNDENLFMGDLNNMSRIAVNNKIKPTPENFNKLIDILDVDASVTDPINMNQQQQLLVNELALGREVKSRTRVKKSIDPTDEGQIRQLLKDEDIVVNQETIERFKTVFEDFGNGWPQAKVWKQYKIVKEKRPAAQPKKMTGPPKRLEEIRQTRQADKTKTADLRARLAQGAMRRVPQPGGAEDL